MLAIKLPETEAEAFVADAAAGRPLSLSFVNRALPLIVSAMTELSGEAREKCLEAMRLTIRREAQTRAYLQRAREGLEEVLRVERRQQRSHLKAVLN